MCIAPQLRRLVRAVEPYAATRPSRP